MMDDIPTNIINALKEKTLYKYKHNY